MGLSDDLAKLDTYVEGVTRKMAGYLGEVLEDQRDKLSENLLANQSKDEGGMAQDLRVMSSLATLISEEFWSLRIPVFDLFVIIVSIHCLNVK